MAGSEGYRVNAKVSLITTSASIARLLEHLTKIPTPPFRENAVGALAGDRSVAADDPDSLAGWTGRGDATLCHRVVRAEGVAHEREPGAGAVCRAVVPFACDRSVAAARFPSSCDISSVGWVGVGASRSAAESSSRSATCCSFSWFRSERLLASSSRAFRLQYAQQPRTARTITGQLVERRDRAEPSYLSDMDCTYLSFEHRAACLRRYLQPEQALCQAGGVVLCPRY